MTKLARHLSKKPGAVQLGSSVEADPGLVGQVGDPLGTQHRRELAQHAWQALGRHHGHAMCDHLAPGDLGAVNGHDRHHYHRRRTASSAGATTRAVAGDGIGRWSGPSPNCQIASETDQ
jgi:hypothetical protein